MLTQEADQMYSPYTFVPETPIVGVTVPNPSSQYTQYDCCGKPPTAQYGCNCGKTTQYGALFDGSVIKETRTTLMILVGSMVAIIVIIGVLVAIKK